MLGDSLFVLWLFLPSGLANMAPVLAKNWTWLDRFNSPVDNKKHLAGKRLLGDHKTWRGFISGWLLAAGLVFLQYYLFNSFQAVRDFYLIDINHINPLVWTTALSLGALGGDAIKSFFKRQFSIAPGKAWVPFDQIDFILGTFITVSLLVNLPVRFYVIALLLGLFLHPLVNILGWLLRLKDNPF